MQQDGEAAASLTQRMGAECLGLRVGRLHRLVVREFEQRLRPLGLSLPQLEILSAMTMSGEPVRPTALADLLGVERSTMSRNLAVLQERGWVRAAATSASGRSLAVAATEAGTAALAAADQAWTQAQRALVDRVGPDAPGVLDTWLTSLNGGKPAAVRAAHVLKAGEEPLDVT